MKNLLINIVVSSVALLVVCALPVSMRAEEMTSGTYTMQSDSINFAGIKSSSASYGLEDTLGEISTGGLSSASYAGAIGFQAMFNLVLGDTTAPTAPPTISASPVTSSSIQITWGESTDNVAVTRYYIYRNGTRIADVGIFPRIFVDTGLTSNTTYSYKVSAADDADNESAQSSAATAKTFSSSGGGSSSVVPKVLDLIVISSETVALVTFKTLINTKAEISWGDDDKYSLGTMSENALNTSHRFLITNLSAGKNYKLRVTLIRPDGFRTNVEDVSFVTLGGIPVSAVPNVSQFKAEPVTDKINLSWKLPSNPSVALVRLVRSEGAYPTGPKDGQVVYEGLSESYIDTKVKVGTKYYYALFVKDINGNFSSGALTVGKIPLKGETVEPETPYENIPVAENVDPVIRALELKDFLFIQNGDSLNVKNGSVAIDGTKNLSVALKSYKVPPVLKTIAVTLVTKGPDPKSFTFILRPNQDKTRYESVIAPLGDTNTYTIKITIIDFKNQGLKKITGDLLVFTKASFLPIGRMKNPFGYGTLLVIIIAALAILWKERRFVFKKA